MSKTRPALEAHLKHVWTPIVQGWVCAYLSRRYGTTEFRKYRRWIAAALPMPPPLLYKQMAVRSAAARFGIKVMIETGTFEGQMVEAV